MALIRRPLVPSRIALCLAAAILLCGVIRAWHPPFAYRFGDQPTHDIVARVSFEIPGQAAGDPTSEGEPVRVSAGQTLAEAGQPLHQEQLLTLQAEHKQVLAGRSLGTMLTRALAAVVLVCGLLVLCGVYAYLHEPRLARLNRLCVLLVSALATVAIARWAAVGAWRAEIIPLLLFGQTVAIAYRRELALLLTGMVALVVVLGSGHGLGALLVLLGISTVAILQLGRIRSRSKLIHVAAYAGVAAFLLTILVAVVENQLLNGGVLLRASLCAFWTLSTGFLITGLLHFIERLLGVMTDISLLELADMSHPLMQELVQRAPGTYNHSIIVGSIAEAAAEAIGAHGLLVRVGAYYHDIGKVFKPGYFVENQSPDDDRHEHLVPTMSTLVIIAHVKDGTNLAQQHGLPESILCFIEQHHGTTLVKYFYGRASERQQAEPNGSQVEESTYRYPGPKPQSKEAGVLMLADSVESACRSLVDPTPARIESAVRDVAKHKLEDGQFDESGLSLPELRAIEDSMIKSLIANYHGRLKYPDQQTA